MTTASDKFADDIFTYIRNQYGKNVLKTVQSDKNKSVVSKLLESAANQHDDVEHAANKIIAMLRLNP